MLTENRRRGDSIALTKGLLIAVRQFFRTGLALSVTFGDTSPNGRGLQQQQKSQCTSRALAFWRLMAYWMPVTL